MLFELLEGTHKIGEKGGSKTYEKGDKVQSDVDLAEKFGERRFRRIPDGQLDQAMPEHLHLSTASPAEALASMISALGINVTADFPAAVNNGFLVFRKGPWFNVAEPSEPETKLNEKNLARSKVEKWVADFVEG
jgi:hypothetical protein